MRREKKRKKLSQKPIRKSIGSGKDIMVILMRILFNNFAVELKCRQYNYHYPLPKGYDYWE